MKRLASLVLLAASALLGHALPAGAGLSVESFR